MPASGSAKAPGVTVVKFEEVREEDGANHTFSQWQVWKQVLIAELLIVLERRRYDCPDRK
jgi:hypothetical protein